MNRYRLTNKKGVTGAPAYVKAESVNGFSPDKDTCIFKIGDEFVAAPPKANVVSVCRVHSSEDDDSDSSGSSASCFALAFRSEAKSRLISSFRWAIFKPRSTAVSTLRATSALGCCPLGRPSLREASEEQHRGAPGQKPETRVPVGSEYEVGSRPRGPRQHPRHGHNRDEQQRLFDQRQLFLPSGRSS